MAPSRVLPHYLINHEHIERNDLGLYISPQAVSLLVAIYSVNLRFDYPEALLTISGFRDPETQDGLQKIISFPGPATLIAPISSIR